MSTTRQKVELIVIGAGIAGLAATRDLRIDGYDVLVLEALNRILVARDTVRASQIHFRSSEVRK
jgi:monoamine oxidase